MTEKDTRVFKSIEDFISSIAEDIIKSGRWLPTKDESVAITHNKVKTAALCYDRIWAPLIASEDKLIPKSIRCWEVSPMKIVIMASAEKTTELLRRTFRPFVRSISKQFPTKSQISLVAIYGSVNERDREYLEGDRKVVVATLADLKVVDERQLTWEEVLEFRADEENRQKYKRFLHWLDKEMLGKSQAFIEDEISIRLEDYKQAIKKHGIKTVIGTVEEALDGKYLLGASGVASSFTLAGHPVLGMLAAGLLIGGKIRVKLMQTNLDFDDVERGPNSEISWVYEAKKLGK